MFWQTRQIRPEDILASLQQMSKRRQREFAEEQWYRIVKENTEDEFPLWLLPFIRKKRWMRLFRRAHHIQLEDYIKHRVGGNCRHNLWCGDDGTCFYCAKRELLWDIFEGDVAVEGGEDLLKPLYTLCPPILLTAGLIALDRLELTPDLQREVMERLLPPDVHPETIYHRIYMRLWDLVDANKNKLMPHVCDEEARMRDNLAAFARPDYDDDPWE